MKYVKVAAAAVLSVGAYVFFQNLGHLQDQDSSRLMLVIAMAMMNTVCLAIIFWQRDQSAAKRKKMALAKLKDASSIEVESQAEHLASMQITE